MITIERKEKGTITGVYDGKASIPNSSIKKFVSRC